MPQIHPSLMGTMDLDSALWRADSTFFQTRTAFASVARDACPRLPAMGEVHLHGMDLDASAAESGLLSADELQRAARFHFERDRHRFIAGRAFVRAVLGRYLEMRPDHVELTYTAAGKPELAGVSPPLRFSLSHSGEWAVLGVSGSELGVDVERLRPMSDLEDVARRFFASREAEMVLAAEGPERLSRFFSCWTRKEAVVKATGAGIGASLQEVEVTIVRGEVPRVVHVENESGEGWSLLTPTVREDLVVAVAVRHDAAWIGS
jgi:4'-phosphopantetheinyl transferase